MNSIIQLMREQNTYFSPEDALSSLISHALADDDDELSTDDLSQVQAARRDPVILGGPQR